MIETGTVYTHYKGGKYVIVCVAHDATDAREGNEVVVYKSVENGEIYCRDMSEFTSAVTLSDGNQKPRFVPEK